MNGALLHHLDEAIQHLLDARYAARLEPNYPQVVEVTVIAERLLQGLRCPAR